MKDELSSNVTWDENKRTGKMTLANGKTAKLEIDVADDEPIPEATLNSVRFLIENEPQISLQIAASVMENYRDWCDDITTPEELAQRINLTEVTFWDDGGGSLYYYPERDMFTGHSICVFFDANGEIGEAEMWG